MNNVSRQSVHLRTILNIQYAYLNGFAEEIGKSDQLLDQKNINLLQFVTKNTDFGATALIEPDGTSHYSNGQTKNVSHRRYYREAMSGKRTLSEPLDSSISGSTRVVLGVPIYKDKKVIGILGGSYDVTALSRMLFEDLFDGEGCSMIIAQSGEVIAFEGDTSYWNIDYRDNFYTYCKKLMIKDNVTAKMIKQDFYKGKSNLVTADSKKKGNVRHYFAYMPMKINNWMLCYAVPEKTAQQSYDFIEHYDEVLVDHYQEQGKLYRLSTSGSTGTPFTVLCDGDKMNRINMNFISCMELNGFRMGMKRGEFRAWIKGKNTISKWKSFKNNLIMVDISNMGDESLEKICRDIEKKKIQVLVPYSSALTALTQYLKRTKRDISRWQVEMIYTMGEALPQETYDLAKELFGFTPLRTYGNN